MEALNQTHRTGAEASLGAWPACAVIKKKKKRLRGIGGWCEAGPQHTCRKGPQRGEGPDEREGQAEARRGEAAGPFPPLQSDNSWGGVRWWCGPRARSALADGGEQQADCFHSASENSECGDAGAASCGCGAGVHRLTPY